MFKILKQQSQGKLCQCQLELSQLFCLTCFMLLTVYGDERGHFECDVFSKTMKGACESQCFNSMGMSHMRFWAFQVCHNFSAFIFIQLHIPPMDALLFPGRQRPGKKITSIGRRLYFSKYIYLGIPLFQVRLFHCHVIFGF